MVVILLPFSIKYTNQPSGNACMKFLGWQLSPSVDSRQDNLERGSVYYIIDCMSGSKKLR